ncbi:MAG: hypothetical protein EZS28_010424 [Streblomastix strix]|uniref:Uncharacterized protein n=1 Tax=Streblomastix strix TaxID=222440 RepID=A0A5J4WGU8_9EUKA|nr:MAG: hypothetical protein EZS28_010424 [Streblomastix strix]
MSGQSRHTKINPDIGPLKSESDAQQHVRNLMVSLRGVTKDNEELRAYAEVLKSSLDQRALQLGLGEKKGHILRDLYTLKQKQIDLEREREDKDRSIRGLEKEMELAKTDVNSARKVLDSSSNEERRVRETAAKLKEERDKQSDLITQMQGRLAKLKGEGDNQRQELDQLTRQNESLDASMRQLKEQQDKTEDGLRVSVSRVGGADEQIKTLQQSLTSTSTLYDRKVEELHKMQDELIDIQQKYEEEHQIAEDAINIQSKLVNTSSEAKQQADELRIKYHDHQRNLDIQTRRADTAERLLTLREQEWKETQMKTEAIRTQDANNAKKLAEEQQATLASAEKEWHNDVVQIEEKSKAIQATQESINRSREELTGLRNENRKKLEFLEKQLYDLENAKNSAEVEAAQKSIEQRQLDSDEEKTRVQLDTELRENEHLSIELTALRNEQRIERKMLHEQLYVLRQDNKGIREKLSELTRQQNQLHDQIDEKEKELTGKDNINSENVNGLTSHAQLLITQHKTRGQENDQLRDELQHANERLALLNIEFEQSSYEAQQIGERRKRLEREILSLKQERSQLVEKAEQAEHDLKDYESELNKDRKQSAELDELVKNERQQGNLESSVLVEKIHKLEDKHAEEIGILKTKQEKAIESSAQLSKIIDTLSMKLEATDRLIKTERSNQIELRKELDAMRAEQQATLGDLRTRGDSRIIRLEDLDSRVQAELRATQIDAEAKDRAILEAQLTQREIEARIRQLESALEDIQEESVVQRRMINEQTFEAQGESNNLQRELTAVRRTLAETDVRLSQLQRDRDDKQSKVSDVSASTGDVSQEMTKVLRMKRELQQIYDSIKTEQAVTETERKQLREELSQIEKDLADVRDRLQAELASKSEQQMAHASQIARLTEELAVAKQNAIYAQRQMKDKAEKHTKAEGDARSIRADFAALCEQRNALESDLTAAVQELENYRDSYALSESSRELLHKQLLEAQDQIEIESARQDQELRALQAAIHDAQDTLSDRVDRLREAEALYASVSTKVRHASSDNSRLLLSQHASQSPHDFKQSYSGGQGMYSFQTTQGSTTTFGATSAGDFKANTAKR